MNGDQWRKQVETVETSNKVTAVCFSSQDHCFPAILEPIDEWRVPWGWVEGGWDEQVSGVFDTKPSKPNEWSGPPDETKTTLLSFSSWSSGVLKRSKKSLFKGQLSFENDDQWTDQLSSYSPCGWYLDKSARRAFLSGTKSEHALTTLQHQNTEKKPAKFTTSSCPWSLDLTVAEPWLPESTFHVAVPKVDTGSKIMIRARPIGWTYSIQRCCQFGFCCRDGCYTVASLIHWLISSYSY